MFRPPRRRQALQSNHGNHDRRASPFPPCPPSPPERVADRVGRRCRPLGLDPDRAPLTVATLWSSWQLASTGFRSPASTRFIVAIVYRLAAFVSRWCCETPETAQQPNDPNRAQFPRAASAAVRSASGGWQDPGTATSGPLLGGGHNPLVRSGRNETVPLLN